MNCVCWRHGDSTAFLVPLCIGLLLWRPLVLAVGCCAPAARYALQPYTVYPRARLVDWPLPSRALHGSCNLWRILPNLKRGVAHFWRQYSHPPGYKPSALPALVTVLCWTTSAVAHRHRQVGSAAWSGTVLHHSSPCHPLRSNTPQHNTPVPTLSQRDHTFAAVHEHAVNPAGAPAYCPLHNELTVALLALSAAAIRHLGLAERAASQQPRWGTELTI